MKKSLTLSIILLSLFAKAQEKKQTISLNYSVGSGSLITFWQMAGGASTNGKSLNSIGLNYSFALKKKNWHLETGLSYVEFKYTSTSEFFPQSPQITRDDTDVLISMPIKLKYEAGKYIFFNGNLYFDRDVSKRPSRALNGIGTGLGMGAQYYFNDKFGVYVNPQFDLRNLIGFSNFSYKLFGTSVAFGLAYRIK